MLDYAALSALAAVLREGSFERAARALHVTPSAVSQRVRALEERLGCALVLRGQPCTATEAGRRLSQHLDQVRLLEQALHSSLPGLAPEAGQRVPLPLAVNADSLATWAAPALAAFGAEAPVLLEIAVDDQDHTGEWLRSGAVLAAVTASAQPAAGCNSRPLGAMRYRATASPDFMRRNFPEGVNAQSLAQAPSLVFNSKDELQSRWVERQCRRRVELPRHSLPSSHAFVAASLAGLGWGMNPEALVAAQLARGELVELLPDTPLDVALHWQHARAASGLLDRLTGVVLAAAREALLPLSG
jgi:LysR family transcriptional regulator (chromosome initiation inhibitor)